MVSTALLEMAGNYYGEFPGPGVDTYELAEAVSQFLSKLGYRTPGVIGVGRSDGKREDGSPVYFLGMSPEIQREVIYELGGEGHRKRVAHFALGRSLDTALEVKFILCWKVSARILESAKFNKGCAEKKIVTAIDSYSKETLEEISVVPHPFDADAKGLSAHVVVGSSDGLVIAPCKSCRGILT